MLISREVFLEKYKELYLEKTPYIATLAYWKMRHLIESGETYYLPEYDCYYMIRDKHLLIYYSPDNLMHISIDELNRLNAISLPADFFDSLKSRFIGFRESRSWNLRYNFDYQPLNHETSLYSTVDFDFTKQEHYEKAADLINQGNVWLNAMNIKRMTKYSAFDKSLWFFVQDNMSRELVALSISEYNEEVKQTDLENTIIGVINTEETKTRGSKLDVLKHGIEIANHKLELMYTKPATTFNPVLNKLYEQNIFSVSEEVWASDDERIDLVIFLNGLAIMTFELKCNVAGQSYQDAIYQYRTQRDPKTRLFRWKAGALVDFAMDLEQVYMTTKLDGASTFFLPFNMGKGNRIDTGAGNPIYEDKYSVYYMWKDILQKDTLIEIFSKFMFVEVKEKKDPVTDKVKRSETVIFPRYHQLDVIRKTLEEVAATGSSQKYLIQHSAGSGKTNSIAWLAHRLASLHDKENKIIFDNIVICTDRVVVDRQLQQAVMEIEHKAGMIRVMDEKCNSNDLALRGNTKIIATTIQKFPHIVDGVKGLKNKKFAVIIDEAHSSTAGKNMAAVTMTLGNGDELIYDTEDMIVDQISKQGKQANVSIFAFTATPKPTTIQLFGRENIKGQKEAFHFYTMKQAIEVGFILDVLDNYLNYETYYKLNKEIEEDPTLQTNEAKRQIARFIQLHEVNIAQRVEIIIEHFRTSVMQELGGHAKAMVVTESRAGAVKYRQAFEDYTKKKGYMK